MQEEMRKPTSQEVLFLEKSYNSFLDIYDEVNQDSFWNEHSYYRLSKVRDAILIYSEIIEYKPVESFLEALKILRPPMEAELSKEYLLFIRNIFVHFPFFQSWDEIKFSKKLINWSKPGRSIDKFLIQFVGHIEIKYRIWSPKGKSMTYVSINFPNTYDEHTEIFLREFMPEKEGVLFVFSLMHRLLMSQVESINENSEERRRYD